MTESIVKESWGMVKMPNMPLCVAALGRHKAAACACSSQRLCVCVAAFVWFVRLLGCVLAAGQ